MFTNVTLLYFLLTIPLSGFIAWLGDRIGHKSGKRRHTLFGLRPRHTAMVFTIGTGMCISFVSFGLMWLFSQTFRVVVRDGVRLYETNRKLKHSNLSLSRSNVLLKGESERSREEAKTADSLREEAVSQEKSALVEREAAIREDKAAKAQVQLAQNQLQVETQRLAGAQADLRRRQQALNSVQGSLKFVQGSLRAKIVQLKSAEGRVASAKKQVADATLRVNDATTKAADAESSLANLRKETQTASDQQAAQLADLRQKLEAEKSLFADQKTKTDAQRLALADLDQQVARGRTELARIQTSTQALREHQITYQVGEEVDRIAIKPGYNVWRIEAILQSFLTTAAQKAQGKGARRDPLTDRALVILPKIITPAPDSGSSTTGASATTLPPKFATEDDAITEAAESIRRSNTDVVVLACATANAVAGEPVAVDLKLYKNPVVFTADTQIGDAHIDGDGSRQEIADAVFNFLRQNVRTTLLHAGIIPQSHGGDQGAASIVNLSGDEWIKLMDRIRQAGSEARVVVTTAREIRAGDSLDDALNIDVKGIHNTVLRGPW